MSERLTDEIHHAFARSLGEADAPQLFMAFMKFAARESDDPSEWIRMMAEFTDCLREVDALLALRLKELGPLQ